MMGRSISLIRSELEKARAAAAEALQHAALGSAQLAALTEALEAAARRALDTHAQRLQQELTALPPTLTAPWGDAFWASFDGNAPTALADSVRVGSIEEPSASERALAGVPLTVPLIAAGAPLLVECDAESEEAARAAIQSLVLRVALTMPAESKFTLLDPLGLGAAFPMQSLLPRVRPTGRTAADELADVLADVRRVNEAVVQHATSLAALSPDARAGEPFEFVVAVDFPEAYRSDPRAVESLVKVANSGPRAGRFLILLARSDQPMPRDFELATAFKAATRIDLRGAPPVRIDEPPPATDQRRWFTTLSRQATRSGAGDWSAVVRPRELRSMTSERRVETPIGERLRLWFGREDDGKPSAHAMVAGQVGSGKSYFLHVAICGLAARYSPDELQLYLIDGKHGVEFEAYRSLPHAAVVCLRTSPEMARSVVEDYVEEMQHRYALFPRAGVADIELYRTRTGEKLPRLLMIVDEYQQILAGDPDRGAALLGLLAEKGRAAGVHLLLGSQNFSAPGLPGNFFNHIHLRAALALSSDYVQGLQLFGVEGRRLIRDLPPSGHVVINDESGRDGANDRGAVARLTPEGGPNSLAEIVASVSSSDGASHGITIDGRDPATLLDNPWVRRFRDGTPDPDALQSVARTPLREGGFGMQSWSRTDHPVPLWLGRRFDVRGHHATVLTRLPGQHALLLGQQADLRLAMVASALAALSAFVPRGRVGVDLVEDLRPGMPGQGAFDVAAAAMLSRGVPVRQHRDNGVASLVAELHAELERRQVDGAVDAPSRLLVIAEPEYLPSLAAQSQGFGPPPAGAPGHLRDLIARGAQLGIHVVLAASGLGAVQVMLHATRELRGFNHRICQQMNEDESMTLFGALVGSRVTERTEHPTACVAVNMTEGVRAATFFKAYAGARSLEEQTTPESLAAILAAAIGKGGAVDEPVPGDAPIAIPQ